MTKEKVLVVVGPTAVGKTALGIELAQKFNGEIISGDSLQVYRKLDIGTAKATNEEQAAALHHLIDVRDLTENYSASDFQKVGRELIADITSRGKLPIVVGGTGLYIQSLLEDFSLGGADESKDIRDKYTDYERENGKEAIWQLLSQRDPVAARMIHHNNTRKIIRALEVFEKTGKSIIGADGDDLDLYDAYIIGLNTDRNFLYERINQRVDLMVEAGVLQEAKLLFDQPEPVQAAQGIGYKEFFPYLEGTQTLDEAVEQVKQNSRRYAKRQLTWFRNRMNTNWFDIVQHPEQLTDIEKQVANWLKQKEV
jgi:tRNA dimethylallyltransferase